MLKKTLSVFLVLCLALSTLGMGFSASFAATEDAEAGIYLSDIEWESWAMYGGKSTDPAPPYTPSRDTQEDGKTKITIAGKQYDKGLRTHPDNAYPADIVYDVSDYGCNLFTATVGKDSVGVMGVVQFQVLLDGEIIAESPLMGPNEGYDLACSIAGGSKLTLRVTDGGDGTMADSSAWGNAMIRKVQEETQDVNITTYGTPIVCCTDPKGQGNKDIGVICDGVFPEVSGSGAQQYDTWGSTPHEGNCYFGMEFKGLCDFTRFVYQTGMHFPDGGWFVSEGLKLQVRQNGEWVDASGYTVSPELPGNTASEDREGSFAVYTFTFQTAVKADAIRIVGTAGGFTSCAEIAVYATAAPEEPDDPIDPEAGIYLSDIEWESWAMYGGKSTDPAPPYTPSRDTQEDGKTKITIAGKQYDKGLRTHPDNAYPADIVYDVSDYGCNLFTATVGKDSVGVMGVVQFQVLLDGEIIAESPLMGPNEGYDLACSIAGGSKLTLRVTDGGDGTMADSSAWGNAMIRKEVVEPKKKIYVSDIEWESWAMYGGKSTDPAPPYTPSRDTQEDGKTKITIAGKQYDKGLRTHPDPSYPADIVYDVSDYGCNLFTATVGKDSAGVMGVVQFQVLLDGEIIAESPLMGPNEGYDLACSIAGGSKLTLRVTDGGDGTMADSSAWGDAMILEASAQEEAQTVIDTIDAIGEVTKENYESKKAAIDIAEAALKGYDKAHGEDSDALALITNRQTLADAKAAYDKFSTEPDEPLDPEAGIYLSDIDWESWAMYGGKSTDPAPPYTPSRDTQEDGKTKITIAGKQYDKGLRTHPDPSYPADIVYDVSEYGCNLFTATVGKDTAGGGPGVVQFQVLLDGEVIAQSPLMGPNEGYDLACSIAGGSKLTLRVTDGGDGTMYDSSAWGDAMIRKETVNLEQEAQAVIDAINAIGEVTKENYESKKSAIDIAEAALKGYDKAHGEDSDALALITNRQALADAKTAYDKFSTEPDPLDPEAGIYLSDIEWESWVMIGGKSTDAAPPYRPSRDSEEDGKKLTIAGQQYDKGLRTHPDNNTPADIVYDVSSYGCNVFTAIAGKDSKGVVGGAQFQVLLDGEIIAQSGILGPGESHEFRCNIAGGSKLTLRVNNGGDGITGDSVAWGNAMIRKETLNLEQEAQAVIDAINAIGEVTKENYESKKSTIDIAEAALKGYDKAHGEDSDALALITNRKTLEDAKAAYEKFSTEPDEPIDPKVGIYLSDIEWESWVMIGGKSTDAAPPYTPSRNSEEHGGKITIAGKQYNKGLRTHPDNDTPADIVYDISQYECTTFSAVVGKDSAGSHGNVKFIVLLDDKVIAESPLLYPGEDSTIECDITGGSKLTLRVTCGDDGCMGDSSAWGNARIHNNPIVVPDDPRKGWVDTELNLTVPEGAVYISDMQWESWSMYGATSADKVPAYQPSFNCNEAGGTLTIAGIEFQKGIRTHVDPSTGLADIVYDISGYEYDLFRAIVGKDSAGPSGNIQFQILVDDMLVVESPILEAGKACMLTVEVAGAKKITLRVRDGRDGIAYDSAGWGNAILYYAPVSQAEQVIKMIQALPEVENLTLNNRLSLEKAQLAFQNLSGDEKQKVSEDLVNKLKALVAKMDGFQELEAAARVVAEQIQALPAKAQLTLRDFGRVQAARAAYEGLTDAQKPYVTESDLAKLAEAEAYLKPLMEAYQTERAAQAQEVIKAIDAIGEITGSNYKEKKELLDAADVALNRYEMLYAGDEEAAALITNRSALNDAWEAYRALQNQVKIGDINADGNIDAQDALLALQYSVGLITLTEEQMTRANVDGSGDIDAVDALLILQHSVNLISKFPVEG